MADYFLHDDIVCNILARLPAKPLLRFRCVSRHWNSMLRKPSFMKLRSRRTIILRLHQSLQFIDENDNTLANSVVSRRHARPRRVIGTFDGTVLIGYNFHMLLYNPFTRVSKRLPPLPTCFNLVCGYGFGYSYGDERDLKVVRIRQSQKICDVYNFKEGSWSSINYNISYTIGYYHEIGTYTNGFLYWIAYQRNVLIVLDVKEMVFSEINLPFETEPDCLGTMYGGCVCALNLGTMWVLKERNKWSKIYSLKLRVPYVRSYCPLCILSSGRILMVTNPSMYHSSEVPTKYLYLIIYNPTNNLYTRLNISLKGECIWRMHVLEYIESMVSPLDIMSDA